MRYQTLPLDFGLKGKRTALNQGEPGENGCFSHNPKMLYRRRVPLRGIGC